MRGMSAVGQLLTPRAVWRAVRREAGKPAWASAPGRLRHRQSVSERCGLHPLGCRASREVRGSARRGDRRPPLHSEPRHRADHRQRAANPGIRSLLLCSRDSPLFHPGDALAALTANGTDEQRHIRCTAGYLPLLTGYPPRSSPSAA